MVLHPKIAGMYQNHWMELRDLIRGFADRPTTVSQLTHLNHIIKQVTRQCEQLDKLIDQIPDSELNKWREMKEE